MALPVPVFMLIVVVTLVLMLMFFMRVMVLMACVLMEILLVLAVHCDGDMRPHDAALGRARHLRMYAGDAEAVEAVNKALPPSLRQQLEQGGH